VAGASGDSAAQPATVSATRAQMAIRMDNPLRLALNAAPLEKRPDGRHVPGP
jgi:hypothetical protein